MKIRELTIKIGAYTLLVFGEIVALILLAFSVYIFIAYPDTSLERKTLVGLFFLILTFIFAVLSLAFFESMMELIHIDKEVEELVEELEKKQE